MHLPEINTKLALRNRIMKCHYIDGTITDAFPLISKKENGSKLIPSDPLFNSVKSLLTTQKSRQCFLEADTFPQGSRDSGKYLK